jgi:hypothetical protein
MSGRFGTYASRFPALASRGQNDTTHLVMVCKGAGWSVIARTQGCWNSRSDHSQPKQTPQRVEACVFHTNTTVAGPKKRGDPQTEARQHTLASGRWNSRSGDSQPQKTSQRKEVHAFHTNSTVAGLQRGWGMLRQKRAKNTEHHWLQAAGTAVRATLSRRKAFQRAGSCAFHTYSTVAGPQRSGGTDRQKRAKNTEHQSLRAAGTAFRTTLIASTEAAVQQHVSPYMEIPTGRPRARRHSHPPTRAVFSRSSPHVRQLKAASLARSLSSSHVTPFGWVFLYDVCSWLS